MGRAPTNSKEKLMETAKELIWSESYNGVSVDEICKKSGVKKGSFYHYFPSKAHLAMETMDMCMEETKAHYDDFFSPTRPPVERFRLMANYVIEQQKEMSDQLGHVCGCPFASLGSEIAAQDENMGKKVVSICDKKRTYYKSAINELKEEKLIAPDTDTEAKAHEIFAFIVGYLIMSRINNDLSLLENNFERGLFDLIGIKQEAQE